MGALPDVVVVPFFEAEVKKLLKLPDFGFDVEVPPVAVAAAEEAVEMRLWGFPTTSTTQYGSEPPQNGSQSASRRPRAPSTKTLTTPGLLATLSWILVFDWK
mmetsp:Transcript_70479/g.153678  ORF Transcript_70479/g.153678 Transcript_70479/m.153678 type:complete len:102 (-) Transcript_70479:1315-1620(-)